MLDNATLHLVAGRNAQEPAAAPSGVDAMELPRYAYRLKPFAEGNVMRLTSHLLEAHLKCPTKCWLRSAGEQLTDSTCTQAQNAYRTTGIHRLLSKTHQSACIISLSADNLKADKWRLA